MSEEVTRFELGEDDESGTSGTFEDCGHDNGFRYWWRSDLERVLGYTSSSGFEKAVSKAMAACTALSISLQENFVPATHDDGEREPFEDMKLSRFACYLTAMNADPRKSEVAKAQAYFATLAEAARQYLVENGQVERVLMRDEMTDREKSLSSTAKAAGVVEYMFFQNAGYRGLYNMNLRDLRAKKGIANGRSVLDFMGREELAANLFRITQTEAKIKKDNVKGQKPLEATAEGVGRQVRETIRKIGGTMPEQLPASQDIKKVRSGLKQTHRQLKKLDNIKKLPASKPIESE